MFATALWVAAPLAHAMYMDEFQGLTFTFDQLNDPRQSRGLIG